MEFESLGRIGLAFKGFSRCGRLVVDAGRNPAGVSSGLTDASLTPNTAIDRVGLCLPRTAKSCGIRVGFGVGCTVMAGGRPYRQAPQRRMIDSLFLPVIVGAGKVERLVTADADWYETPIPPKGLPWHDSYPAGEFQMGCDINTDPYGCDIWGDIDQLPLHRVSLSADGIDKYEVTNARYQACMDAGVCAAPGHTFSNTRHSYYGNPTYAEYPVIFVSWEKAKLS